MKTIAWLAGVGTLLAGVFYLVVSLNRWEWNRALFFGLIVLIAEVGLATGLVLRRLSRETLDPPAGSDSPEMTLSSAVAERGLRRRIDPQVAYFTGKGQFIENAVRVVPVEEFAADAAADG